MSEESSEISFPPGAVADEAVRIPLLWNSGAGIALNKPPGLAAFQDTRVGGGARSILAAINSRAHGGGQFERLGSDTLLSVNLLDRDASGIVLYAKNGEARRELKNAMGSSQFCFRYHFLTAAPCEEDEISCALPVAVHRQKPLALISHRTGKKTVTVFRRLRKAGPLSLWESASPYDRFHQVRLHAAEVGLPILGDALYQNAGRAPSAASVGAGPKETTAKGLCLHLLGLRFPVGETWVDLEGQYPHAFEMQLKSP